MSTKDFLFASLHCMYSLIVREKAPFKRADKKSRKKRGLCAAFC